VTGRGAEIAEALAEVGESHDGLESSTGASGRSGRQGHG